MSGAHIDPFAPVTLSHGSVPLSVSILPYGLTVHSIIVDPSSSAGWTDVLPEKHDLQPNYEDPRDHAHPTRAFFASMIGRFANRLPTGKHDFPGGSVDLEEFSAPGVALHGGPYPSKTAPDASIPQVPIGKVVPQHGPLDRIVWADIPAESSHYFQDAAGDGALASRIFAAISPDGDQGYPGELRIEARFALHGGKDTADEKSAGAILVEYRAGLLGGTAATPLNLTHHWGFNLSASSLQEAALAEKGTVDAHRLQMIPPRATQSAGVQLLGLDGKMLPNGQLLKIARGDAHDFEQQGGKVLGENLPAEGGYDHYYFFGGENGDAAATPAKLLEEERVRLTSATTGLAVSFRTNQTGVQLYATTGQPPYPADPSKTGGARKLLHRPERERENGGKGYGKHRGCCAMLEFGSPHATFLHDSLAKANKAAGAGDTILRKGEVYKHVVIAEVLVQKKK